MVDLNTFLGLAMPNQSCLDVTKTGFEVIFWDKKFPTFMISINSTTDTHII